MSFHSGIRSSFFARSKVRKSPPSNGARLFRILVVDDQPILRRAVADELALAGYEVDQAENATEAIAFIGGGTAYDLVLTDVDMPGPFNGFHLAEFTKYVCSGTRVIVMSGGSHTVEHLTSIDLFLRKPTPSAELQRQVANILKAPG